MALGLIRKTLLPALLLSALFLLASCGDQSTFEVKGEVARRQLDLFWIIFGLAALVFVVVEGALIYSAFRYRRRPGQAIPKQTHGHTKLEIAWTIAPTLVLVGVAILFHLDRMIESRLLDLMPYWLVDLSVSV